MNHVKKTICSASVCAVFAAAFLTPVSGAAASTAEENALEAVEDYSYYSEPTVDSDGFLLLTDNRVITDVSARKLRMKNFEFTIPGAWVQNVVIRTLYVNQTKSENLYKTQIQDSYVIRFFEKETWTKYHSDEYKDQENAASMGEVAEMRLMNNQKNDTSRWKTDPMYIYFGTITKENDGYDAFLYRPKTSDGLIDEDYSSRYGYLSDIDYQGCLISSFQCRNSLELKYPNSYIEEHYVNGFDESGEGMQEGSTIPDGYVPKTLEAEKNSQDEIPDTLNSVTGATSSEYAWDSFTSPWQFEDRGSSYYQNLMSAIAEISVIPTVTPSATVTPSVTVTPEETLTPSPTIQPTPTAEIPQTTTPEAEETPAPSEEPVPSSVPTNPNTNEAEQ